MSSDELLNSILYRMFPAAGASPADDLLLEELPGMDSLMYMQLLAEIEQQLGRPLDFDALADVQTIRDLRQAIG